MTADERWQRLDLLYSPAVRQGFQQARVAIIGIGGVGGYAVEALARNAVGTLALWDPDQVAASDSNRQITALDCHRQQQKVAVMAQRCQQINPQAQLEACPWAYDSSTQQRLWDWQPQLVLDCVDMVSAKLGLLIQAQQQQVPVMSALGAANKVDPAQVRCSTLFTTEKCRLARILRKEGRRQGLETDVPVVYSPEPPVAPLPKPAGPRARGAWQKVVLGTNAVVPPVFGLMLAGLALQWLAGQGGEG